MKPQFPHLCIGNVVIDREREGMQGSRKKEKKTEVKKYNEITRHRQKGKQGGGQRKERDKIIADKKKST
jgi:hypothetical protein